MSERTPVDPTEQKDNAQAGSETMSTSGASSMETKGRVSTADLAYGRDGQSKETSTPGTTGNGRVSLIDESRISNYRERWTSIQTHFIDEPRDTVSDADELVAEVIQGLARRFAEERETLEEQWQRGSEVSTEDLRQAMQHYRSFFERLLAA